jgi:hypothetical protein
MIGDTGSIERSNFHVHQTRSRTLSRRRRAAHNVLCAIEQRRECRRENRHADVDHGADADRCACGDPGLEPTPPDLPTSPTFTTKDYRGRHKREPPPSTAGA